jgi:SNF2 family DNA or RNA helicase
VSDLKFDVRRFDGRTRETLAWKIRNSEDFKLPRLRYWNYDPCRKHRKGWQEEHYDAENDRVFYETVKGRPNPKCHECGINLMQHQRLAVAWMYMKKKGLLADTPGVGKTFSAIGLLAMLYETGEIPDNGKAVFIPRAPALYQWKQQMLRAMPHLQQRLLLLDGKYTKEQRKQLYLGDWDVLLIGPEMYRNDFQIIEKLGKLSLLVTDDVDQLRNPDTSTSYSIDRLGRKADRFFIMTGSPLQKRLPELHAVLDAVGGDVLLGSRDAFVKRHVRYATSTSKDQYGREQSETKIVGYQGLEKVKKRIAPLVLRRTAADITDANFPDVVVDDIFLDLYRPQRQKYTELQNDVLRILKEDGTEQEKRIQAIAKLHYGSSICAGLSTLGEADGPNTSSKFDWTVNTIGPGGSLSDEKVVVFANLKNSIRTLQKRFDNLGVKYVTVWGEESSKEARMRAQTQFWEDDKTQVLIGTRAIEQSLNLQVARHLINVDMILNPERMTQLAGRIRRFGSEYSRVFVHNLLTNNTHEERFLPLLEREAALSSFIWEEKNHLFKELSPMEMLQMITG